MNPDPLGTSALRAAARSAWSMSPTRFREDANLEADHARTHYRDRVVVELAQNAADAAARAGTDGRLLFRLGRGTHGDWELRVANTGAPLDAAGARSLTSLRASAKARVDLASSDTVAPPHVRAPNGPDLATPDGPGPATPDGPGPATPGAAGPDAVGTAPGGLDAAVGPAMTSPAPGAVVGRFGVGFAAVRSVADEVVIGAGDRAVLFSLERAADELAGLPGVAEQARDRGRDLPVLRLPYASEVEVPGGYDTVAVLRLRDEDAVRAVRAQLDAVDDVLLLALPALAEVVVETPDGVRRLADVAARWRIERRYGTVAPALVADRPVEERSSSWAVTWALPRDGSPPPARYHAPTATDETSSFPALLLATFPLDPSRRRVVPGPLTALIAEEAGLGFAALLAGLAAEGERVLGLVPTGLPAGELDAQVRDSAATALRRAAVVPGTPGSPPVRPEDAVLVDGPAGADAAVVSALPLAGIGMPGPGDLFVARALGARVLGPADAVLEAGPLDAASVWRLCAALEPYAADPAVLDAVASLAVPLAGGGTARGPRGLLLPAAGSAWGAALARVPGLRVVAPEAAHPVLERAGAIPADGPGAAEALRGVVAELAAVAEDGDVPDRDTLDAVLAVAREVVDAGGELPFWWGELPLATDDGFAAARECVLPGSWAAGVLDGLAPVTDEDALRYGASTLAAVGVVHDVGVWHVADAVTPVDEADLDPAGPESWLAHWADYLDHLADSLGAGVLVGDLEAVADLDAVAEDAWEPFLARLARHPEARRALLDRVRPQAGGTGGTAPSYTAWWLREELGAPFALTDAVPFLPPVPLELAGLDAEVARGLGVVGDVADLDPDGWSRLADALPPVGTVVSAAEAAVLWRGLATVGGGAAWGAGTAAPDRLPALVGDRAVVTATDDLVVAADPMWAPLRPVLPVPTGVAGVAAWLGAPVAPPGSAPDGTGDPCGLPAAVTRVAGARRWWRRADLRVEGIPVDWWVEAGAGGPRVHAVDERALAAGLAAAAGAYGRRHLLAAVLADPESADLLAVRYAWDS